MTAQHPETRTVTDLASEMEKAVTIRYLQRRLTEAEDRLAAADLQLQDATREKNRVEAELNTACDAHPNTRPIGYIVADIVRSAD